MNNLRRVSLYIMYLTDIAALILSFFGAYYIRMWLPRIYVMPHISYYMPLLFVSAISYVIVAFGLLYEDNFLGRRAGQEIFAVIKMIMQVVVLDILILFFTKTSEQYSRVFVGVFVLLSLVTVYVGRIFVKKYIFPKYKNSRGSEKIAIITIKELAPELLKRLEVSEDWRFQTAGLIFLDEDCKGQSFEGHQVISNREDAITDIEDMNADSFLLRLPHGYHQKEWLNRLQDMGKTVYLQLEEFYYNDSIRMLDYLGDCAVVSYLPAMPVRGRTLVIKRFFDVLLSLLLLPVLLFMMLLVSLLNLLGNRGPLMIPRERMGKNGRRFQMYRFRIYRMEERKEGEEGQYSAVGRILHYTHLDGLPMIWNVLVGDMSFIGPEAVSIKEYIEHDPRNIRNLCTRPGIMGLWAQKHKNGQISDINEYIHTWNLKLDIRIFLVSVLNYLTFQTVCIDSDAWSGEEIAFINDYLDFRKPLEYSRALPPDFKPAGPVYLFVKRTFDILGSAAGLLLLSPLFLLLMILVIANNGGNPFYGHRRVGKNGKRITVYKFTSMRRDADNLEKFLTPEQIRQYRTEFKLDDDPRITRFGNFLRKSSLDELPQLYNILRGDLSIVGPRPVMEEETFLYGADQAKFLSAKPGLTGYWQAYARNQATYETGERQKMELYYVDHQSLLFDIRIMFHTVGSVIRQNGAQ